MPPSINGERPRLRGALPRRSCRHCDVSGFGGLLADRGQHAGGGRGVATHQKTGAAAAGTAEFAARRPRPAAVVQQPLLSAIAEAEFGEQPLRVIGHGAQRFPRAVPARAGAPSPPCCTGPGDATYPGLRCLPRAPAAPPLRHAPWCRHGAARPLPRDATRRPAPARSTAARHRRCPRSASRFRDWRRGRCPLPMACRGTPAPVHGRRATLSRQRAAALRRSSGRVRRRRTTRRWTRTRARSESASGFRRPHAGVARRASRRLVPAAPGAARWPGANRRGPASATGMIFSSSVQGRLMPRAGWP